jgi:magnesium transporter
MSLTDEEGASYTSIGIGIAISGNILISLALNIQKVAHKHVHEARVAASNHNAANTTGSNTPTNGVAISRTASITPPSGHHDFLESRPLLPRTASSPVPAQGYGATKSKTIFNIPRIFKRNSGTQSHDPITSPRSANGELEYEHDDTDELDEAKATESDYLRSKLWCVSSPPRSSLTLILICSGGSVSYS